MPNPSFAENIKTAAALLVSAASVLSLISFFPSEPKILAAQIGISCAIVCSIALLIFFWTRAVKGAVAITTASLSQKVEVILGLPVSLYALLSMFHFAFQMPHFWSAEIGMLGGAICSLLVFSFCWAAPFAYVIRKRDWPPRACSLAGLPLVFVGAVSLLHDWFWNPAFPRLHGYAYMAVLLATAATTACRKLAYPEMGASDFYSGRRPPTLFLP